MSPIIGTGKAWGSNAELNNYTTTGIYYIGSGTKIGGASSDLSWGTLVVIAGRSDTIEQTFIANEGKRFYREYRNSVWSTFYSIEDNVPTLTIGDIGWGNNIVINRGSVAHDVRIMGGRQGMGFLALIFKNTNEYAILYNNSCITGITVNNATVTIATASSGYGSTLHYIYEVW